ncbi:MAG: N-acetyltransferase family protein [Candidatus Nanoarchaeia archaeon]
MIKIRKAKVSDAEGIGEMRKEGFKRKAWPYSGRKRFTKKGIDELRDELSSKSTRCFIAIDTNTKRIVGSVNCDSGKGRLRHRVGLGWGVHPDYMGQGIGTKLLQRALDDAKKRGFKRAEAEMAVKNTPSWKMALNCGFKIEGQKKKGFLTDDGKYIDTYVVGKIL